MHKLTRNHNNGVPCEYISIDCETCPAPSLTHSDQQVHMLWFGWACKFTLREGRITAERWHRFQTPQELWTWVYANTVKRRRTVLAAHWLAYDLTAGQAWAEMEAGRLKPAIRTRGMTEAKGGGSKRPQGHSMLVVEDPPTVLDLLDPNGNALICVDTMNWYPRTLAECGEALGVPKMVTPGDDASAEDWEAYCRRDVEIVMRLCVHFSNSIKSNDLGNWSATVGAQALKHYRHVETPSPLVLGHDPALKAIEREAYVGMVCRAYHVGAVYAHPTQWHWPDGPGSWPKERDNNSAVYRYDVNSCYPHCMRGADYPVHYIGRTTASDVEGLQKVLDRWEVVARVRVQRTRIPTPMRTQGGLRWVLGTLTTVLCGPDLREHMREGSIVHVYEMQWYKRGRPFEQWAQKCEAWRSKCEADGDKLGVNLSKLVSNALHGKFGAKSSAWVDATGYPPVVDWGTWYDHDHDTGETITYRSIGGHVQRQYPRGETEDGFPLISAYVTSYARALMWRIYGCAGAENVLYMDADSIHVTPEGRDALVEGGWTNEHEWGKVKLQGSARSAVYRGPKNYTMDGVDTIAGVPKAYARDVKGCYVSTRVHRLTSTLMDVPPQGPISEDYAVHPPQPTLDGRLSLSGHLDWPVEIG